MMTGIPECFRGKTVVKANRVVGGESIARDLSGSGNVRNRRLMRTIPD